MSFWQTKFTLQKSFKKNFSIKKLYPASCSAAVQNRSDAIQGCSTAVIQGCSAAVQGYLCPVRMADLGRYKKIPGQKLKNH